MNIALTGVSGFIGSCIARRLYEQGHYVTGLVRASSRRDHVQRHVSRFVVGEQDDAAVWNDFLRDAECVIHASVDWTPLREPGGYERHVRSNLLGSLRLLRASAPRQFIFLSTIAVHHDMRPRWEGRIDEDHPLRPNSVYGAYKAAVEAFLWAEHFGAGRHTSAVRPCGVYGTDPRLEESLGCDLVRKILAGERVTRSGGGKWVHVEDVAAAVCAIVGNPDAAGRAYNLADCYARWADWARWAAEAAGVHADIDFSSPERPVNEFTKDAVRTLGVTLDRGHDGIREYLARLVSLLRSGA